MTIHVDSDQGRIGSFWWFNADTRLRLYSIPGIGNFQFTQQGSCGWGTQPHIVLTPVEPFDP